MGNRTFSSLLFSPYLFKLIWWCDCSDARALAVANERSSNLSTFNRSLSLVFNHHWTQIYRYTLIIDKIGMKSKPSTDGVDFRLSVCPDRSVFSPPSPSSSSSTWIQSKYKRRRTLLSICSHCYKMKSSTDELNEVSFDLPLQHVTKTDNRTFSNRWRFCTHYPNRFRSETPRFFL